MKNKKNILFYGLCGFTILFLVGFFSYQYAQDKSYDNIMDIRTSEYSMGEKDGERAYQVLMDDCGSPNFDYHYSWSSFCYIHEGKNFCRFGLNHSCLIKEVSVDRPEFVNMDRTISNLKEQGIQFKMVEYDALKFLYNMGWNGSDNTGWENMTYLYNSKAIMWQEVLRIDYVPGKNESKWELSRLVFRNGTEIPYPTREWWDSEMKDNLYYNLSWTAHTIRYESPEGVIK